jgi:peptide/nickel transport system permease protein
MIFALVMSINLLGDGIRDVLDPRLRSGALNRPLSVTSTAREVVPPTQKPSAISLLEVEGLETGFRNASRVNAAVKGVSFALDKGECLGLIGESGSGKSVTALSLMGLVASPPGVITGGAAYLEGRDLFALREQELIALRGARVAYVFQDPLTTLHPLFPVGEQIAEAVTSHSQLGKRAAAQKAVELMETVGIRDAADRASAYPHELSGGQRQRIGIAMAIANDPDVIIADEPTTALDVTVQARILDLLQKLRRDRGLALLLITHDFGVVAQVCDRVAVMKDGEIVEQGRTEDVLGDPQHDYTKRLIACVPEPGQGRAFLDEVRPLFADRTKGPSG